MTGISHRLEDFLFQDENVNSVDKAKRTIAVQADIMERKYAGIQLLNKIIGLKCGVAAKFGSLCPNPWAPSKSGTPNSRLIPECSTEPSGLIKRYLAPQFESMRPVASKSLEPTRITTPRASVAPRQATSRDERSLYLLMRVGVMESMSSQKSLFVFPEQQWNHSRYCDSIAVRE